MAITFTLDRPELIGTHREVTGLATFDSSYPTGGEPFTAANVGLATLDTVKFEVGNTTATNAFLVMWNRSTSAPTARVFQGDNTNAAAAPAIEVPNATNLSALAVRFTAIGV
jgi:hypothetical protein